MNFTVIVLSGIDRNLSIALSVSSAWNPPFIRLLGPPLEENIIKFNKFSRCDNIGPTQGS